MSEQEALRLLPMTVVRWIDDNTLGTVRQIDSLRGLYIDWTTGERGWLPFSRAHKIELW